MNSENCRIINQYGREYSEAPSFTRCASRGIIVKDGKILLSHELNTGVYLIPGGGVENEESCEECCIREIREETGCEVLLKEKFLIINEHFYERLYTSCYFVCEAVNEGEPSLTENEISHGVTPEWVSVESALEIFGNYASYASVNEEIEGQYKREYTAICEYLERK